MVSIQNDEISSLASTDTASTDNNMDAKSEANNSSGAQSSASEAGSLGATFMMFLMAGSVFLRRRKKV